MPFIKTCTAVAASGNEWGTLTQMLSTQSGMGVAALRASNGKYYNGAALSIANTGFVFDPTTQSFSAGPASSEAFGQIVIDDTADVGFTEYTSGGAVVGVSRLDLDTLTAAQKVVVANIAQGQSSVQLIPDTNNVLIALVGSNPGLPFLTVRDRTNLNTVVATKTLDAYFPPAINTHLNIYTIPEMGYIVGVSLNSLILIFDYNLNVINQISTFGASGYQFGDVRYCPFTNTVFVFGADGTTMPTYELDSAGNILNTVLATDIFASLGVKFCPKDNKFYGASYSGAFFGKGKVTVFDPVTKTVTRTLDNALSMYPSNWMWDNTNDIMYWADYLGTVAPNRLCIGLKVN